MQCDSYSTYEKLQVFTKALRIRMIEEAIAKEYSNQEMRCPTHLSIGQEINAVAISDCLRSDDQMVSTHRGHAHYLSKGGSLDGLIGELYGLSSGCGRGNAGSMHLVDRSCGFIGTTSIVGGTVPIGVGAAFAAKLKKEKKLVAVCFGDAALEEGVVHESMNFASVHSLPVIFFMENNLYSCYTKLETRQPKREHGFEDIARAHGMSYFHLKWDRFIDDSRALRRITSMFREDPAPIFVNCDAYRFVQHCGHEEDDHLSYRPPEEVLAFRKLDPLKCIEVELRNSEFLNDETYNKIIEDINTEIKDSFSRTKEASPPQQFELGLYTYA